MSLLTLALAMWAEIVPAHPDARLLCNEHISGNTMHIVWQSYATPASFEQVVAFYEKAFGTKPKIREGVGVSWHAPSDDKVAVSVVPVKDADKLPSCKEKARAGENTVILVSRAIK